MHSVSSKLYQNLKIRVLNSRDHKLGFKLLGQTLSLLSQTGLRFETENTDLSYTWHVIMFEQQEMSRGAKVRHERSWKPTLLNWRRPWSRLTRSRRRTRGTSGSTRTGSREQRRRWRTSRGLVTQPGTAWWPLRGRRTAWPTPSRSLAPCSNRRTGPGEGQSRS